MSIDFNKMLSEVHPSFCDSACDLPKSISNETLARLAGSLHFLKEELKQRLHKIQNLGSTLIELWSLMDVKRDEQKVFDHVTSLISSSAEDIFDQGCLAIDVIEQAELEVQRLNVLKASKMKELVFKKQNELDEILRSVHMDVDGDEAQQGLAQIIESGNTDLSELLSSMDNQIAKAEEHALSRIDILEKVDKWKFACEEASWLDEYEMDQNRYNAGRGAHKNLKRAEKARILVSKMPSMVENLVVKVKAWESEKGMKFLYNKVPLLGSLEEYTVVRQQREDEKRRSRDQKRLQEQFAAEKEALFGMKPSPMRQFSAKKPLGLISNINTIAGTPTGRRVSTPFPRHGIISLSGRKESVKAIGAAIPINYVSLPKDG